MAYIKPGYLTTRSYPHNYWQSRFPYFPCFEIRSHTKDLIEKKEELQSIEYKSDLCFRICLNSEVEVFKRNIDYLLSIDEDLFICEN